MKNCEKVIFRFYLDVLTPEKQEAIRTTVELIRVTPGFRTINGAEREEVARALLNGGRNLATTFENISHLSCFLIQRYAGAGSPDLKARLDNIARIAEARATVRLNIAKIQHLIEIGFDSESRVEIMTERSKNLRAIQEKLDLDDPIFALVDPQRKNFSRPCRKIP